MEQIVQQVNQKYLLTSVTLKLIQIERFLKHHQIKGLMNQEKLIKELECFKKYLVLNYSLREITINGHLGNINRMLRQLKELDPEREQVTEYVYVMKKDNKSVSHVCNNISSIEKFMDYKKRLVRYSKPRRIRKLIVDILTEAEINRMIYLCKNIKEKAMITLLAYSGIRNRSFCDLKVKDIDFGNNFIIIHKVKGRREYTANISSECIKILLKYIEEFSKKPDDYLFTTKVKGNKYNPNDIRKIIKVLGLRAKIQKIVYPHLLRHSLASNMLNRGANIILIKEQLGHDWLQSTENYLTSFPQRIKCEYEIFKPSYI